MLHEGMHDCMLHGGEVLHDGVEGMHGCMCVAQQRGVAQRWVLHGKAT